MKELLKKLTDANGVSGYEDDVRALISKELSKHGAVETDRMGNVICTIGSGKPRIMLAAHMDEIGLLVKHIDDKGFIRVIEMGGVDDDTLPTKVVKILTEKGAIPAIVGFKPPHLKRKEEERKKKLELDDMYLDTGLKTEDVKSRVQVGDPVVFDSQFIDLGENVIAKALDNRAGCLILIEAMKRLKASKFKGTVYGVATVQEELGLKGARTSAFKLDPDFALALDVGIAGDTPDIKEDETSVKMGKGPAITVVESSGRGMVPSAQVKRLLIRAAVDADIPYQLEATKGGMTDGAVIYMTREGIRTGGISVPTRYIHSPSGICNMGDVENAVKLTMEFVKRAAEIY